MSNDEHDDPQISLATVDQIADELERRFRNSLIVVDGPHQSREETTRVGYYSRGSAMGALGLAAWAVARLSEPDDDSDDEED